MDAFEKELEDSQKRGWLIPMLMLGAVGLLSASVVVIVYFYSDFEELFREYANVYLFNFLLVGFVLLAGIFMGYLILRELGSKKLHANLIRERIASHLLERRVTELEAVRELTSLVNSEIPLSDILDTICKKALTTLHADQCSLFLYDPKIDRLLCVSVFGPKSEMVKESVLETGRSVAGWVIEHGEPLHLDQDIDPSRINGFVNKDRKISSGLCLPLKVNEETRGVLNITLFDQRRKFEESDLKLASIFAENAAVAIDKAGLYERLQAQTKTMKNVIKELKATRDKLVKPETVSALGKLASGMANDFTTTLDAIRDKMQELLREMGGTSIPEDARHRVLKLLKEAEELAASGSQTAEHVGTFAGVFKESPHGSVERLDINAVLARGGSSTNQFQR
ncbi:MAG: GAF domain-containing protein [Candidatus Zixiibacteriota bacterium]|nr:MAG: GAF domain-containing protein [candidate division Zixibacteria bacterium]